MKARRWLDHYVVLVLLILVMVGGLILSSAWSRYQDYVAGQSRLAENSVRSTAAEINLLISGLRRSVRIFAQEKSDLIGQLAGNPDNDALQEELRETLLKHFPEYFAFTVTDAAGVPAIDDFGELVGAMCQNNLIEFASRNHPQQVFIHPSPVAYHFDVMTRWQNDQGERGVFFVSFHPDMIARLLAAGAIPGHKLLLLKQGTSNLIEVTEEGVRNRLDRDDYELSEQEVERILVRRAVPDSLWELVDMRSAELFRDARNAILFKDGLILLIFVLVTLFMLLLVKWAVRGRSQAMQLNREKSEFLSTMSHEIRTPLNSVIGFAELLDRSRLDAEQTRYVNGIRQSGHALLTLINDILDLSKMDAGKLQTESIPFDLRELVDDIVQMFAEKAYRKGIVLTASVPVAIPVNVVGDPTHVRQVLVNLIGNAIKFTEQGRVLIRVDRAPIVPKSSKTTDDQLMLRLSVIDSGIGLAPEDSAKLFESFTQADTSTTRKYGGTGLGLAISRRLVELMGGEIGVNSEPGQGAEFWFTVPLLLHDEVQARESSMMTPTLSGALSGLRVQVVEHNEHCRDALHHNLHLLGVEFLLEDSAARALLDLRKDDPDRSEFDLLLIDADTPDLTGPDLARIVLGDERIHQAPIVMMTGFGDTARRQEARQMGIRHVLSRPFGARDLYQMLGEASGRLAPTAQSVTKEGHEKPVPGRRVLVVDDNDMNLSVAQGMLKLLGCSVLSASGGEEALAIAEQHRLDLVLLDCEMPEVDGFETLHRLHQDGHLDRAGRVPVVALTANSGEEDRKFCIAAGFDDFLSKPVTLDVLREILNHWTPKSLEPGNRQEPVPAERPPGTDEDLIRLDDLPVVDEKIIGQMRRLNTEETPNFFLDLLNSYDKESQKHQQDLQQLKGSNDAEALRKVLHNLKGAAALVGAKRVEESCEGALKQARAENLIDMPERLDQLFEQIDLARDRLKQYL